MPYQALDPDTAAAAPAGVALGEPLTNVGDTFLELKEELDKRLGGRSDVSNTRLGSWVNQGYIDLASSLRLDQLEASFELSVVADQPFYLLPDNVFAIQEVALNEESVPLEGRPLDKIDKNKYRALPDTFGGFPKAFFRYQKILVLWPTPDQSMSVTVDAQILPAKLEGDTNSSILGIEWDEAILLASRWKGFDALLEFEQGILAKNAYLNYVRERKSRSDEEQHKEPIKSSVPRSKAMLNRRNYRVRGYE